MRPVHQHLFFLSLLFQSHPLPSYSVINVPYSPKQGTRRYLDVHKIHPPVHCGAASSESNPSFSVLETTCVLPALTSSFPADIVSSSTPTLWSCYPHHTRRPSHPVSLVSRPDFDFAERLSVSLSRSDPLVSRTPHFPSFVLPPFLYLLPLTARYLRLSTLSNCPLRSIQQNAVSVSQLIECGNRSDLEEVRTETWPCPHWFYSVHSRWRHRRASFRANPGKCSFRYGSGPLFSIYLKIAEEEDNKMTDR